MAPEERTTTALLEGLRASEDSAAWSELDRRIRPIVYGFARRRGLDEALAADAAQETFLTFLKLYRDDAYDRKRGRLTQYILSIAVHRIEDVRRRQARHATHWTDAAQLEILPEEDPLVRLWQEESDAVIVARAMERLQESRFGDTTIEAFRRVWFGKQAPAEVAADLNIEVGAVYLAKLRCGKRLREIIAQLNEAWELV